MIESERKGAEPRLDDATIFAAALSAARCFKCQNRCYVTEIWLTAARKAGKHLLCCGRRMWISSPAPWGQASLN
jgi:hypothetical protein